MRGNSRNAVDCLRTALPTVPKEFRDIVLVSLGSILHKLGYLDAALKAASEALTINAIEVRREIYLFYSDNSKKRLNSDRLSEGIIIYILKEKD